MEEDGPFSQHVFQAFGVNQMPDFGKESRRNEFEDLEMQAARYKPECLDSISERTKFSKKELQILYRGFKQDCPTGIVSEDVFKEIYGQFFPQGDSNKYAHLVFRALDADNNGTLNFEEFIKGLSVLSRGHVTERLQWAFKLYDVNRDGIVTKDEMVEVVSAIYDMMGPNCEPVVDEESVQNRVEYVFKRMDKNSNGEISFEEFMDACVQDTTIQSGLIIVATPLCINDSSHVTLQAPPAQ